jgi:hypothetical protein
MRDFALHPSIMYFNSDGELRDAKRWEKTDPPEHVSGAHIIAHSERLSHGRTDFFDDTAIPEPQPEQLPELLSAVRPHEPTSDSVEGLRRENLLLKLEAGYADRLRKQYLFRKSPSPLVAHAIAHIFRHWAFAQAFDAIQC